MNVRTWRFITLLLAALALGLTSAHVLELAPKLQYDAALYAAVNTTMYRYFASIGAIYSVGQILAGAVLAYLVRWRPQSFRWTLTGVVLLVGWFASWLVVVAPVNSEVAAALGTSPDTVPALWLQLRARWEYGHATGFALQLLGFCALLISVLVDTPEAVGRRAVLKSAL